MKKILVIGERGIDKFIYCKNSGKLAPDKPIPIITVDHVRENPGMAGNFVANFSSLFPEHTVVFVHQNDLIFKSRYIDLATNHYYLRIDEGEPINETMTIESLKKILQQNNLSLWDFDAICISSYNKGFVTKELISLLCLYAKVFYDGKDILENYWARDIYCAKINEIEYNHNLNQNSELTCQNLIVSLGERGAMYKDVIYPARKVEVTDVSGAGDIMFAGLVGLFLNGLSFEQSIPICNVLCSLAVARRGVNILNEQDLEMALKLTNYPL